MAREDAGTPGAPAPPRVLAPLLRFNHLPDRALASVERALQSDEAFRARVLAALNADDLDEGARLFLQRPEGWRDALEILTAAAREDAQRSDLRRRESGAIRRAEQLETAVGDLRSERDELVRELQSARSSVSLLREELDAMAAASTAADERIERLEAERARAVRQLKETEVRSARRLKRQRELSEELTTLRDARATRPEAAVPSDDTADQRPSPPAPEESEPVPLSLERAEKVSKDVARAARAAEELATALKEIAGGLAASPSVEPASGSRSAGPARKRPRRAVRLGRGLLADSVEGFAELLSRSEAMVLVDGYNVSMQEWPELAPSAQRDRLLSLLGAVQARNAAEIHVVFDGAHEGRRPAVSSPLPVRVHFTEGGVEADDRLLEFAESAPTERAVVVVSSDNRVREGARSRGANVVSTEVLLQTVLPNRPSQS